MITSKFEPLVLEKSYRFYAHLCGCLGKFPKPSRYTIGERMESSVLLLMEEITLANIQIKNLREPILYRALSKCELLKILLRFAALEIKLIDDRNYLALEGELAEIGRMLGGWIKYLRAN